MTKSACCNADTELVGDIEMCSECEAVGPRHWDAYRQWPSEEEVDTAGIGFAAKTSSERLHFKIAQESFRAGVRWLRERMYFNSKEK